METSNHEVWSVQTNKQTFSLYSDDNAKALVLSSGGRYAKTSHVRLVEKLV